MYSLLPCARAGAPDPGSRRGARAPGQGRAGCGRRHAMPRERLRAPARRGVWLLGMDELVIGRTWCWGGRATYGGSLVRASRWEAPLAAAYPGVGVTGQAPGAGADPTTFPLFRAEGLRRLRAHCRRFARAQPAARPEVSCGAVVMKSSFQRDSRRLAPWRHRLAGAVGDRAR